MDTKAITKAIDDTLSDGKFDWKDAILYLGMVIYLGGVFGCILFAWTLVDVGVSINYRGLAHVGLVIVGGSAIVLPLALHFIFHDKKRRTLAWIFYILDLTILALNAMTAFNYTRNMIQPGSIFAFHLSWIAPLSYFYPVVVWGVLLPLSPERMAESKRKQRDALREEKEQAGEHLVEMAKIAGRHNAEVEKAAGILREGGITVEELPKDLQKQLEKAGMPVLKKAKQPKAKEAALATAPGAEHIQPYDNFEAEEIASNPASKSTGNNGATEDPDF